MPIPFADIVNEIIAAGTSEGAKKGWESRGGGGEPTGDLTDEQMMKRIGKLQNKLGDDLVDDPEVFIKDLSSKEKMTMIQNLEKQLDAKLKRKKD